MITMGVPGFDGIIQAHSHAVDDCWPLKTPIKKLNAEDTNIDALLAQAEEIKNRSDEFLVAEMIEEDCFC